MYFCDKLVPAKLELLPQKQKALNFIRFSKSDWWKT